MSGSGRSGATDKRRQPYADQGCRVYWGSHGCHSERWHKGPHWCDCCTCERHPDPDSGCVAGPPYYGDKTSFYGDDVTPYTELGAAWFAFVLALGKGLHLDRFLTWLNRRLGGESDG